MDYGRSDRADALAADYVIGTLRGAARRRFEALLPAHAELREATMAWRDRLMPLTAVLAPVQPSSEVWRRISDRLEAGRQDVAGAVGAGQQDALAAHDSRCECVEQALGDVALGDDVASEAASF